LRGHSGPKNWREPPGVNFVQLFFSLPSTMGAK